MRDATDYGDPDSRCSSLLRSSTARRCVILSLSKSELCEDRPMLCVGRDLSGASLRMTKGAGFHLIRQPAAVTCLAAARSRRGSDSPPDCHSTPRRRFATLHRGRLCEESDENAEFVHMRATQAKTVLCARRARVAWQMGKGCVTVKKPWAMPTAFCV